MAIYAPGKPGGVAGAANNVVVKIADYTAVAGDFVLVDATNGPVTVTPPITSGAQCFVKKIDASANAVTIAGNVDGGPITLPGQYIGRGTIGDGTKCYVIAERKPFGSPVDLGGAASDGATGLQADAGHVHGSAITYTQINPAGSTQTLHMASKDVQAWDVYLTANLTVTIDQWLTGRRGVAIIRFHQDSTPRTVSWAGSINWPGAGYTPATPTPANTVFEWIIWTPDGGTTLNGSHGQIMRQHRLFIPGALTAGVYKLGEDFLWDARIGKVFARVGGAPSGAALTLDVMKLNGNLGPASATTIYSTTANRPTVANGAFINNAIAQPDTTIIAPNDALFVNVITASSATDLELLVATMEAA